MLDTEMVVSFSTFPSVKLQAHHGKSENELRLFRTFQYDKQTMDINICGFLFENFQRKKYPQFPLLLLLLIYLTSVVICSNARVAC